MKRVLVTGGGGAAGLGVSLCELTAHCQDIFGRSIAIDPVAADRDADIPWYVTDNRKVMQATGWQPRHMVRATLEQIATWLHAEQDQLRPILT